MARRNISLPDDIDTNAREAGLNVSALARRAVAAELDRRSRMAALERWLDELDEADGAPTAGELRDAEAWLDGQVRVEGGVGQEA